MFLIVFWPGRDYIIGNYNFYKNRKHIHDVYMKAESFVNGMEIELFSKLLELFFIFCLCFFDLSLSSFLVFLQLKSSLILFRSANYSILIRLQHETCDRTRTPLHTPKTLETCKEKHALFD